jgi:hypothetical protein
VSRNIEISSKAFDIGTVSGINNVVDDARMEPHQLKYAYNIDISDKGRPSRRGGNNKVVTPSGTVHSMWGDDKMCFYVENGVLKRLHEDYTSTTLRTGVSNYHMNFVEVNDKYYYTNPTLFGYIYNGVDQNIATPTEDHKYRHSPGQHIEYYNSRIYVARNNIIWYSDVNYLNQVDRRYSFMQFENEITMMKAVSDGIWICVGDHLKQNTYFMQGATREEFTLRSFASYGCIENSEVKIKDGSKVGEGLTGSIVMWASDGGICIGANGGRFINITDGKFNTPDRRFGAGLFRDENGLAQYITTLWE